MKIIKEIENVSAKLSMIYMASLYKLGSFEAFKEADEFVKNRQIDQNKRDCEITIRQIYTLFAINQEQYELAYDELLKERSLFYLTHLKILVLIKSNRLKDAFNVLNTYVNQVIPKFKGNGGRLGIVHEVIKMLSDKILESDDDEMKKLFTDLMSKLDDNANLVEDSLEALIVRPPKKLENSSKRMIKKPNNVQQKDSTSTTKSKQKQSLNIHQLKIGNSLFPNTTK